MNLSHRASSLFNTSRIRGVAVLSVVLLTIPVAQAAGHRAQARIGITKIAAISMPTIHRNLLPATMGDISANAICLQKPVSDALQSFAIDQQGALTLTGQQSGLDIRYAATIHDLDQSVDANPNAIDCSPQTTQFISITINPVDYDRSINDNYTGTMIIMLKSS